MKIVFTLLVLFLLVACTNQDANFKQDNKKIKTFELKKLDIVMPSLSVHSAIYLDNSYYSVTRGGMFFKFSSYDNSFEKLAQLNIGGAEKIIQYKDKILIGSYLPALFMIYDTKSKNFVFEYKLDTKDEYVFDMFIDKDEVYISTYPNGTIYVINLENMTLKSKIKLDDIKYSRSIIKDGDSLFVGTGTKAKLLEIRGQAIIDILPKEYSNEQFVYSLSKINNNLFIGLAPSYKILKYDLRSKIFTEIMPNALTEDNYIEKPNFSQECTHFKNISDIYFEYCENTNSLKRLLPFSFVNNIGLSGAIIKDNSYIEGITRDGIYLKVDFKGQIFHKNDLIKYSTSKVNPFSLVAHNNIIAMSEKRILVLDLLKNTRKKFQTNGETQSLSINNEFLYGINYPSLTVWKYPLDSIFKDSFNSELYQLPVRIENQNRPKYSIYDNNKLYLLSEANYGNYGGKLSTIINDQLELSLDDIFNNQTPKKIIIDGDFYYISTTTKGGSGTDFLNENASIIKYNYKNKEIVKKIDYINTKSFNDIEYYDKKIYAIDLRGTLHIIDENNENLEKVDSSLKFLNFINSIDGNLYIHTIDKIYKIKDKSFVDVGLKFNAINRIVEDKVTSYWYLYADDNLFQIR